MNWSAQAALIAMLLENGTAEGREQARKELALMGQLLDDSRIPFSEVGLKRRIIVRPPDT